MVNPKYVERVKEIEKRLKTAFKEFEVADIDIVEEPEIFQKKRSKRTLAITITLRGN